MKIIKIDPNKPSQKAIKICKRAIEESGIIVYPTDTAYGIGVNALSKKAVQKLYNLKKRDQKKPTHVVVRNWQMVKNLTYTNKAAQRLFDKFLPGPLTIVLKKKDSVPDSLTANLPTLGVRMPDSAFTKALSALASFPYTTPSANRQGEKTPYSMAEVKKVLDVQKVDLIIDAGKLPKIAPSTIVDLSGEKVRILRQGPVGESQIRQAIQTPHST